MAAARSGDGWDTLEQAWIVLCGIGGLVLVNLGCGCGSLVGLAGQIAWVRFACRTRGFGVRILTGAYTAAWTVGAWRYLAGGG